MSDDNCTNLTLNLRHLAQVISEIAVVSSLGGPHTPDARPDKTIAYQAAIEIETLNGRVREIDALKHDIERHVAIAAEQARRIVALEEALENIATLGGRWAKRRAQHALKEAGE